MSSFYSNSDSFHTKKIIFFGGMILISLLCVFFYIFDLYSVSLIIFAVPFLVILSINFERYFHIYFVLSLFIGYYLSWTFRLQISLLFSIVIIFFFLTNNKAPIFNRYRIPRSVKLTGIAIISSVYISSVFSPYFDFSTFYYATLFLIFITSSYVIFRSVKDGRDIYKLLDYFVIFTSFSGITALLKIIISGNMRSFGISSWAIIDFAAFALIIVIFGNFLFAKIRIKYILLSVIIFIVLITTQSRFAWLGFLLTSIYGLIVCFLFSKESREFFKKRIMMIVFTSLLGISIMFSIGLDRILVNRISDINLSLFQSEDGRVISNSLETRILIWITAINTFKHNPVSGVGYLKFSEVSENYNILPDILFTEIVKDLDAHTTYLNFLCETGIIGLIAFISYILTIYYFSLKSIKLSKRNFDLRNSIVLNLLVFFVMVHSIYSGAFTMGQNAFYMHFIFGLTIANYKIIKN